MFILGVIGVVVGWFLGITTMIWYIYDVLKTQDHIEIGNKKLFIIKE